MEGFFNSDPWSDFYGLAHSPFPANSHHRLPTMPSVAPSKSRYQRRPAASSTPVPARKPRVVSVPVHCSGDDGRDGRRAAATRIQKVFRGFQVRRMVEKVSRIASEVDAIEGMLASRAEVEKIRSDPREKLRVDELLMRLLLRLDSVHGVRYYRRKVIRRAMRMQEMVDSITSAEQTIDAQPAEERIEERSEGQQSSENNLIRDAEEETERTVHAMQEEGHFHAIARNEDVGEKQPEVYLHAAGGKVEASKIIEAHEEETVDEGFLVLSMDEELNSSTKVPGSETVSERSTVENDSMVPSPTATDIDAEVRVDQTERKPEMVNENLLQLVTALREQSAQQCKLIEGLTSRVSNLEHALQEMERRKKDEETFAKSL